MNLAPKLLGLLTIPSGLQPTASDCVGETAEAPEDPVSVSPGAILEEGKTADVFYPERDRWGWMDFMNLEFIHLKTTCELKKYVTVE